MGCDLRAFHVKVAVRRDSHKAGSGRTNQRSLGGMLLPLAESSIRPSISKDAPKTGDQSSGSFSLNSNLSPEPVVLKNRRPSSLNGLASTWILRLPGSNALVMWRIL